MNVKNKETQTDSSAPQKTGRSWLSSVYRVMKWIVYLLITIVLLLIIALGVIVYTPLGTKLADYVVKTAVPNVTIGEMQGTLHHLNLNSIRVTDDDSLELSIASAHLSFSPLCLLQGKICIETLTADTISGSMTTSETDNEDEESDTEMTSLNLPLELIVESIQLRNLQWEMDGDHYAIGDFSGRLHWQGDQLNIEQLNVDDVHLEWANQEEAATAEKKEASSSTTDSSIDIQQTIQDLFANPFVSSVPQIEIPLNISLQNISLHNAVFDFDNERYQIVTLDLKAELNHNQLRIERLNIDFDMALLSAQLELEGDLQFHDHWPVDLKLSGFTISHRSQLMNVIDYQLTGDLWATSKHYLQVQGLNNLTLEGEIDPSSPYLPMTVEIKSNYLQWPLLATDPQFHAQKNLIQWKGTLNHYQLLVNSHVETTLEIETFNNEKYVTLHLEAQGNDAGIHLNEMSVQLPQGNIELSGAVDWQETLQMQTQMDFQKFDFTQFMPELAITLDGQLEAEGALDLNDLSQWHFMLNQTHVTGMLKQKPFLITGTVSASPEQIDAQNFNLVWGENRLTLKGNTQKDLLATIDLKNLSLLADDLSGAITGQVHLNGHWDAYRVHSDLKIAQLQYDDLHLKELTIKGEVSQTSTAQGARYQGDMAIIGRDLTVADQEIKQLKVNLKGDENNHQLALSFHSDLMNVDMGLTGQFNLGRTEWKGSITKSNLSHPLAGAWSLDHPILIDYRIPQDQLSLSAFCLKQDKQSICLDQAAELGPEGELLLSVRHLNIERFTSSLSDDYRLSGRLGLKMNLLWNERTSLPKIHAELTGKDLALTELITLDDKSIAIEAFQSTLDITETHADLDFRLKLAHQLGSINGKINVADPMNKKHLSGQITINHLDFKTMDIWLDDSEQMTGYIQSNLTLSGTLEKPLINGYLDLIVSELKLIQINTNIESIQSRIQFQGDHSSLEGTIKTTTGTVQLTGDSDWRKPDQWLANLNVQNGSIDLTIPSLLSLTISPDIKIKATSDEIDIKGKVTIPKALITIDELPKSVVQVSDDVVLLNKDLEPISAPVSPFKINLAVNVVLGNDVQFDAYGLKAQLAGSLMVNQSPKGLAALGKVTIPDGRYHAYGQDLIIDKGEFIFSGPIDNPNLSIEAIRNPDSIEDDVVVGLRVTGFADHPNVDIFSEPAMSQQEALSYLFSGQGLDSETQSNNDMMSALLIGLSASQGGQYLGDVGSMFGVKDLSVDTIGVGNDQRVVVSGYLHPRLRLKYSVGIFDALAVFSLRYRLLPKLYLEASSGAEETVDLIYHFEI